jgi:SPP1 family predicted phage head-tail adaptor
MNILPSGQLRTRIELRHSTETKSATGQSMLTWTSYATVWAAVEDTPNPEQTGEKQIKSLSQSKITIRYIDGLLVTDRVIYDGATYGIVTSPAHDPLKRQWQFTIKLIL